MALPAHAQPAQDDAMRAVARQLGVDGIEAYQKNEFTTADEKLERAYRLFPAPTLGLFSARARVKLGLWVEAAERYRQATRSSPEIGDAAAQKTAQQEATQELEALLPRIPTLTVVLARAIAADVSVTFDKAPYASDLIGMARPTNPGTHQLVATRGNERVEQTVTLAEKERKTVTLTFAPPLASQPTAAAPTLAPATPTEAAETVVPQPALTHSEHAQTSGSILQPLGVAAVSLGAVGLITWGVSSLIADGKLDKCTETNGEHLCDTQDQADSYRTAKTISMVSFWSGAVLAVGGAGLLLWQGREHSHQQSLTLRLTPVGASVRGAF